MQKTLLLTVGLSSYSNQVHFIIEVWLSLWLWCMYAFEIDKVYAQQAPAQSKRFDSNGQTNDFSWFLMQINAD